MKPTPDGFILLIIPLPTRAKLGQDIQNILFFKKEEAAVRLHPRGNDPIILRDSRPKKISYILMDKASSHSIDNIG